MFPWLPCPDPNQPFVLITADISRERTTRGLLSLDKRLEVRYCYQQSTGSMRLSVPALNPSLGWFSVQRPRRSRTHIQPLCLQWLPHSFPRWRESRSRDFNRLRTLSCHMDGVPSKSESKAKLRDRNRPAQSSTLLQLLKNHIVAPCNELNTIESYSCEKTLGVGGAEIKLPPSNRHSAREELA